MIAVIGVEGSWSETAVVTWGAAAVTVQDGFVKNSITGLITKSVDPAKNYTEFSKPITIDEKHADSKLIVAMYRREHPFAKRFRADTGKTVGLIRAERQGNVKIYIFADRAGFDTYATSVAQRVVIEVLFDDKPDLRELVRAAQALTPRDLWLNLANVYVESSTGDPVKSRRAERMARTLLSATDLPYFDQLVEALTNEKLDYEIKYEGGIAASGGLNLNDAIALFQRAEAVQKQVREAVVIDLHPALRTVKNELPSHRAVGLKAASASLKFAVSVKGESPLIRLARYIELHQLQNLLRGEIPEQLQADAEFMQNLYRLICPDDKTTCSHRPVGSEGWERAFVEPASVANGQSVAEHNVCVLGFVEGIMREAKDIDIRTSYRDKLQVSRTDNGDGHPPKGVGTMTAGKTNFLFRPFIFDD